MQSTDRHQQTATGNFFSYICDPCLPTLSSCKWTFNGAIPPHDTDDSAYGGGSGEKSWPHSRFQEVSSAGSGGTVEDDSRAAIRTMFQQKYDQLQTEISLIKSAAPISLH